MKTVKLVEFPKEFSVQEALNKVLRGKGEFFRTGAWGSQEHLYVNCLDIDEIDWSLYKVVKSWDYTHKSIVGCRKTVCGPKYGFLLPHWFPSLEELERSWTFISYE